ncbi:siroheme synthase CysG [Rhizobiaceae bacterium]|nr:siroheme synthase CysG [Rhizobiaceae bacterium]
MQTYPIFLKVAGRRIVFSGAGDHAAAKIKLLLKTEGRIAVYGSQPCADVLRWASEGQLILSKRPLQEGDALCAALLYGANDDPEEDARAADIGRRAGALVNIVDNLADSQFLTPALVDRDPVIVAIGTEGTAPVLARKIKSEVEALLPTSTGVLARVANGFRGRAAKLRGSQTRRDFWARFFFEAGPKAYDAGGEAALLPTLEHLHANAETPSEGQVSLIGTGPGDPELLTLKARRVLHQADVVLHDRLVSAEILELARREATVICVGKRGYGASMPQAEIDALMVEHARTGARVARLKSGDAAIFGRLDEELDALDAAGVAWDIVPGITTASAAAASLGRSLTRRGRNSQLRFLTARDVDGMAEHDWRSLAAPGAAAAIYMGLRAATFLSGRLLMHGASADTPVTIIENVSRADQRTVVSSLATLVADAATIDGPAILFLGLTPRAITTADLNDAAPLAAEG